MNSFFNVLALISGVIGALAMIVWVLGVVVYRNGEIPSHDKAATLRLAMILLFMCAVFFIVSRQG